MTKHRVLAIDDQQIVLDSVRKVLQPNGFVVDVSLDGRQGVAMALSNDYDIIITDVRMPDYGGIRILRDVTYAKPALPVIIMTGYATVKSAVQAMKLGAADYIQKPFTPEELAATFSAVLHRPSTENASDQAAIHHDEVIKVLERAAADEEFKTWLLYHGPDALDEYTLSKAEKISIITGDVTWLEQHVGSLTPRQRSWLTQQAHSAIRKWYSGSETP